MLKHYSMQRKENNFYNGHGPVWEAEQSGTEAGQTAWEGAEFCGPTLLGSSWLVRVCAFGTKVLHLGEHSDTSLAAFLQSSLASELQANLASPLWPHSLWGRLRLSTHAGNFKMGSQKESLRVEKVPSLHARGSFLTNLFLSLFLFLRCHLPILYIHMPTQNISQAAQHFLCALRAFHQQLMAYRELEFTYRPSLLSAAQSLLPGLGSPWNF